MYKSPIKITVIKKLSWDDVYGHSLPEVAPSVKPYCVRLEEGQEFVCDGPGMPEGFCAWAWSDIRPAVLAMSLGGDFPWYQEKGVHYACCTDGARPVFFKLERMEGESQPVP